MLNGADQKLLTFEDAKKYDEKIVLGWKNNLQFKIWFLNQDINETGDE